jgi:hypothetical protein
MVVDPAGLCPPPVGSSLALAEDPRDGLDRERLGAAPIEIAVLQHQESRQD